MKPFDFLEYSSRRYPDKVALECGQDKRTYAQLRERVLQLACAMKEHGGIRPGDCIGVWCTNCIEYMEIELAAQVVGAVPDLYSTRFSSDTVLTLMELSNVGLTFIGGRDGILEDKIEHIRFKSDARIVAVGTLSPGCDSYEDFLAQGSVAIEPYGMAQDDVALQLYTSGTTGLPKCVQLTCKNVVTVPLVGALASDTRPDDVMLVSFPFYHAAGLVMLSVFLRGAQAVIGTSSKVAYLADAVSRHGITLASLPPMLIQRMVDYAEQTELDFSSLRLILYGAQRVTPELILRCRRFIGEHVGFYQMYGMTETGAALTALTPEDHEDPTLLESAGRPLMGVAIRIVDDEGRQCPAGVVGEVVARSDTLMKGYRCSPELTTRVIRDGWYYTHDAGFVDERGYLYIVGRKDRMIISGGENIFPEEIEQCMCAIEGVADAAAIGVPDDVWGQSLVAFVVCREGSNVTAEEIRATCGQRLAGYKKPKQVVMVDALPRTLLGKVSETELRRIWKDTCVTND